MSEEGRKMYCRKCGQKIKDGAKFCSKCGAPMTVVPVVKQTPEEIYPPKEIKEEYEKPKKSILKIIIIILGALLLISFIAIFIILKFNLFDLGSTEYEITSSNSDTVQQDTTDEDESTENTATSSSGSQVNEVFDYINNDTVNLSACLTTDAYETVHSEDGTFSFAYPKYIFNSAYLENGTYTFEHNNGVDVDYRLKVYKENNSGDPVSNAQSLYRYFSSSLYSLYYDRISDSTDSHGMSRALVAGYYDSAETDGVYIIAANDGTENYILEFEYYDNDKSDQYKDINYVVDCIYRYCSFSGTTYRPRTFSQFAVDDMGEKK